MLSLISIEQMYKEVFDLKRFYYANAKKRLEDFATQNENFKFLDGGNALYVANEEMLTLLRKHLEAVKAKTTPASRPAESHGVDDAEVEKRISQLEELALEQEARLDALHKATQELTLIYEALRAATSDPKQMPAAPKLPSRYKWRVLIVGGDYRTLERVQPLFNSIKFLHLESGGAAGDKRHRTDRTNYPRADAVFIMTAFIGHSSEDSIRANYPKDIITRISGSVSALESALHVWLNAQERIAEQRAHLQ